MLSENDIKRDCLFPVLKKEPAPHYTHNPLSTLPVVIFTVTWPFPGLLKFSEWAPALPPAFPHEDQ